jgi:hypothetical protein
MNAMLMLLDILKALLEVAGLALLGQGLLFLFAGAKRDRNVVYQVFATVTRPVMRITRFVTPRIVLDRHLGLVAFLLVGLAWFLVLVEKQSVCTQGALGQPSCAALAAEYGKRCQAGQEASCELLRRNGLAPVGPEAKPQTP